MSRDLLINLPWPLLSAMAVLGLLLGVMPRLTRPDIFFAVTVLPDFRNTRDGLRIVRQYQAEIIAHTIVGALLVGGGDLMFGALARLGLLWQAGGCVSAFIRARRRATQYAAPPTPIRETDLTRRTTDLPGGWVLQALVVVLLAGAAGYLSARWQDIPAKFPTQWSQDGTPIRWSAHDIPGVYGGLLSGSAACAGLALMAFFVVARTRRIRVAGPAAAAEGQFRRRVAGLLIGLEGLLAVSCARMSLLPVAGPPGPLPVAAMIGAMIVFVGLSTAGLLTAGQGGTRRLAGSDALAAERGQPVGDRTADRHWMGGILYLNRNDSAFLVEKRFGVGYTLNLGHPAAWILLAVIVLVPLLLRVALR